jgi:hypothetical protein
METLGKTLAEDRDRENREFFARKRRVERSALLTVVGTGAAILAALEFGLPNVGPYVFTLGCVYTLACELDRRGIERP